jgi:hypothetical protein
MQTFYYSTRSRRHPLKRHLQNTRKDSNPALFCCTECSASLCPAGGDDLELRHRWARRIACWLAAGVVGGIHDCLCSPISPLWGRCRIITDAWRPKKGMSPPANNIQVGPDTVPSYCSGQFGRVPLQGHSFGVGNCVVLYCT